MTSPRDVKSDNASSNSDSKKQNYSQHSLFSQVAHHDVKKSETLSVPEKTLTKRYSFIDSPFVFKERSLIYPKDLTSALNILVMGYECNVSKIREVLFNQEIGKWEVTYDPLLFHQGTFEKKPVVIAECVITADYQKCMHDMYSMKHLDLAIIVVGGRCPIKTTNLIRDVTDWLNVQKDTEKFLMVMLGLTTSREKQSFQVFDRTVGKMSTLCIYDFPSERILNEKGKKHIEQFWSELSTVLKKININQPIQMDPPPELVKKEEVQKCSCVMM